jgi:hypothetical protein
LRTVPFTPAARRSGSTTAVEHDVEAVVALRLRGDRLFERDVVERDAEGDDALVRPIGELGEERAALVADRHPERLRVLEQLAQRRVALALVADVEQAQRLGPGERLLDGVDPVDHVVQVDPHLAFGRPARA